jgi:hypothetical protein
MKIITGVAVALPQAERRDEFGPDTLRQPLNGNRPEPDVGGL